MGMTDRTGKKEIRVLFTSVGRRVELMQAFKAASERLGVNLIIYGADICDSAPALLFCNKQEIVCKISNPDYIPRLLEICMSEHIDAVVPTIDTDLLLLSQAKEKFTGIGTRVVISAENKVRICRDKRYTADYFINCGLKSPITVDDYKTYTSGFPAFIKPKDGSSSIHAFKVHNAEELESYTHQVDGYIVQPFIEGTEYTVDIFCDFDGNPVYITPRERIAVRSGEVLKTKIRQDETIKDECKKLITDYKPCGAITVQLIKKKATGDNYYIEINPRFGGGAPLSMKAGADSAEAMIRLLCGEKIDYIDNAADDAAVYSRFDQSICVSGKRHAEVKAVIFDLDDTLYSEIEYVRSGYANVAAVLLQVQEAEKKLWNAFETGKVAIDYVLQQEGIYSEEVKMLCLNAYRSHTPNIKLYNGVVEMINSMKEIGIKVGIITDGRPEGQRKKIEALHLADLVDEILITDELGGIQFRKPNDIAFRIMQVKMDVPFESIVYVGDNPKKDFIAPRKLGMQSVWFRNNKGIYFENVGTADRIIDSLSGLVLR